jgi:hypothetical protein
LPALCALDLLAPRIRQVVQSDADLRSFRKQANPP